MLAARRERPRRAARRRSPTKTSRRRPTAYLDAGEQEGLIEGDERRLLQSIVDFGDTLVREVMTPRPDIVAIRVGRDARELRAFFREQEYSRIPVYAESLDNIVGFVFIKDLMRLPATEPPDRPVVDAACGRRYVVPETKRVSELLREFQRQQLQIAIVVDEYGGTAGLVTLEDLLEEIVGEIRDEYDVETEPVVDEGNGRFVCRGKADIDDRRPSGSAWRSSARASRRSAATCWRTSAACRRRARRFEVDGLRRRGARRRAPPRPPRARAEASRDSDAAPATGAGRRPRRGAAA